MEEYIPGVEVRFEWAEQWLKSALVYGAWIRARYENKIPVSIKEAKFIWEAWNNRTLSLVIRKEDYAEIFPKL